MTHSQSIHGSRHPIKGCNALPPNWKDSWSWLSRWVFHCDALVCMVTHWTRPIVSHNLILSSSHDLTKLFHYVVSQPWENIEFVLKLLVALTYKWDRKLIIYSLWIGHCWWKLVVIGILNRNTMISHGIKTKCPHGWS